MASLTVVLPLLPVTVTIRAGIWLTHHDATSP